MKKIEAQVINNFKDLNIKVLDKLLNFDTAVKLFSSSKYVITNRLHVFLIAMNVGTKTFIVTDIQNHRKLISIVSDLNLQSLIFNEGSKHSLISENEMEIFKLDAFNNKNELVNNISNLFK